MELELHRGRLFDFFLKMTLESLKKSGKKNLYIDKYRIY
jgi:hypothetical protein